MALIWSSGGSVYLEDVIFDNIRTAPKEDSAAVYWSDCGDEYYDCGDFSYISGSVTRLNNGFEFSNKLDFRGFLLAKKIKSVYIEDVTFKNNQVYAGTSMSTTSLIALEIFRNIAVTNCTFSKNLAETGLIYLKATNINMKSDINADKKIIDYTINHVTITDSVFENNFGENIGILNANYQSELQNIYLENLHFKNNLAEKGSIIEINNKFIQDSYKVGQDKKINISGRKTTGFETKRTCI